MSKHFWEPLPGWFILRWAVWIVLSYLAIMLVYGTFFRDAQPWPVGVVGVVVIVAAVVGVIQHLIQYRNRKQVEKLR